MAVQEPETDYLQLHGLDARAPADLNASLVRAIEEIRAALPARGEEELTRAERSLFDELGVPIDGVAEGDDPVAATVLSHAALVETGWSVAETARRLQLTTGRVRQLLGGRELYGFHSDHRWVIPAFQFREGTKGWRLLEGIRQVNCALPADLHPSEVAAWYRMPESELVQQGDEAAPTPLEWLRAGGAPERLAALAETLGEAI